MSTDTTTNTTSSCCAPSVQATCCEPSEKAGCCSSDSSGCGCSAGSESPKSEEIREAVRSGYAAAAVQISTHGAANNGASCCGSDTPALTPEQAAVFGEALYEGESDPPAQALLASLGCGNPTAVAELNAGETVLDLGSGGGIDVLLSAKRVGPTGKAYGLDMTDEMLALARTNQAAAGIENAEFIKGTIEDVPLPDSSVDAVISNCVINLSGDKQRVLHEAARVLRRGGRFAVTDVLADSDMDEQTRNDMDQWVGCIGGALSETEFRQYLSSAGFAEIDVQETHRVHEHAYSAIVRATLPA